MLRASHPEGAVCIIVVLFNFSWHFAFLVELKLRLCVSMHSTVDVKWLKVQLTENVI